MEEDSSTPHVSSNQVDISPQEVGLSIDASPIEVEAEDSQKEKSESDVGPKRKQFSKVWNHFRQKVVDGRQKAECIYCNKLLVGGPRDGTRHLTDHTNGCKKRKNQDIRQSILAMKPSGQSSSMTTVATYHFNQDVSRRDLAEMVILHEYPLSIVDHYAFRKFCTGLQPLFTVVSRNTLKKDVLKIYDDEKAKMMALLNKNRGRIAITCDMWTANHQNKSYMAITAHFVDNAWVLQHRILR